MQSDLKALRMALYESLLPEEENMKRSLLILLASSVLSCSAPFTVAAVYLEQKTHMDPTSIMGQNQPARDIVQKIWLEGDKMATDSGDGNSMIIRLDQKKLIIVNHGAKSYQATALPIKFPPEMEKMMGMMQFKADVRKTGEAKVIRGYNCQGVEMTMTGMMNMTMKMKMWCTQDIKIPFEKYYAMSAEMVSFQPSMKEMMDKMKALAVGIAVETDITTEVMGAKMHMTTSLVKAEAAATAPQGAFDTPAGYKMEEFNPMKAMQPK